MKSAPSTKKVSKMERPIWKAVMQLALSNGACRSKHCTFSGCRIYQIAKANMRKK